jgi:predicted dithiol-disulfide oxidoreductase (DUF899 family)
VSNDEWLIERKKLLTEEKELTKHEDRVNAQRRRMPMVKVETVYAFHGPQGLVSLLDLFEGQRQLIVYHFMFDPDWEEGCEGCTSYVDALGDLSMLEKLDTRFVLISRAGLPQLDAYKAKKGWKWPWYSSYGSEFNCDFHVTLGDRDTPYEYNYMTKPEMESKYGHAPMGEEHGLSVFFRLGDEVYHTYSTYGRGTESLTDSYALLDTTAYGRQQEFEESPAGWPQHPTYG